MADVAGEASRNGEFRFGEWLVRPRLNQLSREGNTVHLRPKVMDVLVHLAEHGSEVVSKEELVEAVWAKEFLADSALSRAVFELREVLGDDAQRPRYIETIPKRGYRLVAPVVREEHTSPPAPHQELAPAGWRIWRIRLAVVALLVVGGAALVLRGREATPARAAAQKKLVVLPFENLGRSEDEYLAAGMTDEISGRLARVSGLSVVSRGSAAQYARTTKTTKEIAQELGVDYLLAGTIRWDRGGAGTGRVRIIPRLIRVADDTHLWADVYDRVVGDVFAVQTDIAEKVAQQLDLTLHQGERDAVGRIPTSNPEAYEMYLRGLRYTHASEGEEAQRMAATMFERAVELDPAFVAAWRALSDADGRSYHYGFDRTEERRSAAKHALDRAIALAPDDPDTHLAIAAHSFLVEIDSERALTELDAAERKSGPTSTSLARRGYVLRRLDRFAEARDALVRALELSPRDSSLDNEIAITDMFLGRYDEADRYLAQSAELTPDQHTAFEWSSLNRLLWKGSLSEAHAELAKMPPLQRSSVAFAWWLQEICEGDYVHALERLALLPGETCALQFHYYPRSLMEADVYDLMGERQQASNAYDAARAVLEGEASKRPEDPRIPSALGLAYAGLGRRADAVREGERALTISPESKDSIRAGFSFATLARIHLVTGDRDAAARLVERLLTTPTHPAAVPLVWLDPRWAPLRDHPRLRSLTVGRPQAPEGK
jgi:TolB-like protein/DNA-binding winged helix-turn-helix (wHTH) protein/Flp pilus assembly protein TadD